MKTPEQKQGYYKIVFNRLKRGGIVSSKELADELWKNQKNGGPLYAANSVSSIISDLRKAGLDIIHINKKGVSGYMLDS